MVLPPQRLNAAEVAKVMAQSTKRIEGEARAVAAFEAATLRMWCVERAVEAVGTEGVIWVNLSENEIQPRWHSAVVPLATEILDFVLASPK